ncbi:ExeA family protein [Roseateles koreensis]|uniref:AAA family ATPase n=1 Tax=Roseateles koreensis TaxID=2987526 RepID=A0ABT5KTS6_9BURK|nr:AAA family ATPase [Roseateles koreensis]MDC8785753.1 AAA family ATPase [Roseateles koreensis]
MYAKFFGLRQAPFSIAPDPHYLFMSERHREALAHLLYGLQGGGGFVLLTGEIGAGKTTVCRCFLEQIPDNCNVAYIFNPKLSVPELLQTVCQEFHLPLGDGMADGVSVKTYVDAINAFLLRTHALGQNNILIIDEAQNLSADVLEQLRLLTNLETHERKLLQIILIGQPELRTMLATPELEQLAQRVIARFHLQALSESETAQYVSHRLGVAGLSGQLPFDGRLRRRIHQLSRGVPRRINLLCDRSLLGAYAQGHTQVDMATLKRAAAEVFGTDGVPTNGVTRKWVARGAGWTFGLLAATAAAFALAWAVKGAKDAPPPVAAAASAAHPVVVASMAAPTPAPTPVPKTPASTELLRDEAAAWRALAQLWRLNLPEGEPCALLAAQQLQCFNSADGGLALLRMLGRPSILTLQDESGQAYQALLIGLGDQTATLQLVGQRQTWSLLQLSRQWRGEFATLWHSPPGFEGKLGSNGPALDAVARQLAQALGEPAPTEPTRNDAVLRQRVAQFQRSQGLAADGLAGPITLMQLNRVTAVDEARLESPTAPNQRVNK